MNEALFFFSEFQDEVHDMVIAPYQVGEPLVTRGHDCFMIQAILYFSLPLGLLIIGRQTDSMLPSFALRLIQGHTSSTRKWKKPEGSDVGEGRNVEPGGGVVDDGRDVRQRQVPLDFELSRGGRRALVLGAHDQVGEEEAVALLALAVRLQLDQEAVLDEVARRESRAAGAALAAGTERPARREERAQLLRAGLGQKRLGKLVRLLQQHVAGVVYWNALQQILMRSKATQQDVSVKYEATYC